MKKFLLSLIAILSIGNVWADNYISVSDVVMYPGGTAAISLDLTNSNHFANYEFLLTLPEGITTVNKSDGTPSDELTDRTVGYTTTNLQQGGNVYKYTGYLFSLEPEFQGSEGTIVRLFIEAAEDLSSGTELEATISKFITTNQDEADASKQSTELNGVTFKIKIENTITLDEASTETPRVEGTGNVIVKRTIKADEWSTICLPFDITMEQAKEIFGDDVQFAYFAGYTVDDKTTENQTPAATATNIVLEFETDDLSNGTANYPFLIKTSKDISEFSVENVDVYFDEENAVEEYKKTFGSGRQAKEVTVGSFYGTLHAGDYVPEDGLFLSGNKFYYSTGKTKIKGFRGYFVLNDILADKSVGSNVKMQVVVDGETAIENVRIADTEGAVYTVDGKFIGRDVDTRKLQKGIYIVDGKKVAVK